MPVSLQIAILLFFGVGLLVYVRQAWRKGEVRMGNKGFEEFTPSRDESPGLFYLGIMIYIGLSASCLLYTIMLMIGDAEPISLR